MTSKTNVNFMQLNPSVDLLPRITALKHPDCSAEGDGHSQLHDAENFLRYYPGVLRIENLEIRTKVDTPEEVHLMAIVSRHLLQDKHVTLQSKTGHAYIETAILGCTILRCQSIVFEGFEDGIAQSKLDEMCSPMLSNRPPRILLEDYTRLVKFGTTLLPDDQSLNPWGCAHEECSNNDDNQNYFQEHRDMFYILKVIIIKGADATVFDEEVTKIVRSAKEKFFLEAQKLESAIAKMDVFLTEEEMRHLRV